ncbi:hypothetical protein [Archangium lipolyticum]|uniref:hypothetical protein n=1 Tax=Archangium lipolyticum TaxID=2970465 RepID=UPI00214A28E5|nr:hypothetical protein [Archangium lipolyticum]
MREFHCGEGVQPQPGEGLVRLQGVGASAQPRGDEREHAGIYGVGGSGRGGG